MTTHDLSEIWKQLRNDLLADSGLVALLGSTDAIYRNFPQAKVIYPILVLEDRVTNPATSASFTGLWRPDVQIDVLALSDYTCRKISGYLQEKWSIPRNRTTTVQSTNFTITQFHYVQDTDAGRVKLVDTGEIVRHLVSEWKTRIIKRTA